MFRVGEEDTANEDNGQTGQDEEYGTPSEGHTAEVKVELEFLEDFGDVDSEVVTHYPTEPRRSGRSRSASERYTPDALLSIQLRCLMGRSGLDLPCSCEEARSGNEREQCYHAMKSEMNNLRQREVIELVELIHSFRPIQCRWVYNRKLDKTGRVKRHRARLVAKEFMQKYDVDYCDVSAPVVNYNKVRMVLALIVDQCMFFMRLDIKPTFLYSTLDQELYLQQPRVFEGQGPKLVYHLWKAIYGLKQASRAFGNFLHPLLTNLGAPISFSDPSLHLVKDEDMIVMVLIMYVDDVHMAGKRKENMLMFVEKLSNHVDRLVEMN